MNEETLFHLALEKPPHERAAFLAQAGAADPALCRRVELLLRAHDAPVSLLDWPALEAAADPSATLDRRGARPRAAEAPTEPVTATSTAGAPADTASANRMQAGLLAQSGKDGKVLWAFTATSGQPIWAATAFRTSWRIGPTPPVLLTVAAGWKRCGDGRRSCGAGWAAPGSRRPTSTATARRT